MSGPHKTPFSLALCFWIVIHTWDIHDQTDLYDSVMMFFSIKMTNKYTRNSVCDLKDIVIHQNKAIVQICPFYAVILYSHIILLLLKPCYQL